MSIHVKNLSSAVTLSELENIFSVYGVVERVQMPIDPYTGVLYGFAFIAMRTELEEKRAIKALNSTNFMDRIITVTKSRRCRQ
ncbi:MAG: RNA-binding protein [Cyanobacteria bacterium P01_F01_bin.150]